MLISEGRKISMCIGHVMLLRKLQIPTPKAFASEHPSSREAPIVKIPKKHAEYWILVFGASLDVEAWNLELCSLGEEKRCGSTGDGLR
jgi:hypothetical protein